MNADAEAALKKMKEGTRRMRTARSKHFNKQLRDHGIDPDKFKALVKRTHGTTTEEFVKLMWQECRLEKKCPGTESP